MTSKLAQTLDNLANEFQYDPSGRWGVETVGPIREAARIIAALEKQPAASGEPVAWQYREANSDGTWTAWLGCDKPLLESTWRQVRPLYAAPQPAPARVPLTEESIKSSIVPIAAEHPSVYMALCYESGPYSITELRAVAVDLVRAIEAAHGIFSAKENPE